MDKADLIDDLQGRLKWFRESGIRIANCKFYREILFAEFAFCRSE